MAGMLAELERVRELTLDLIDRATPQLQPPPPDEATAQRELLSTSYSAHGARSSVTPPRPPGRYMTSSSPKDADTRTPPLGEPAYVTD